MCSECSREKEVPGWCKGLWTGIPLDKRKLKMGCLESYVFLPIRAAIIKVCEHLWNKKIGEWAPL